MSEVSRAAANPDVRSAYKAVVVYLDKHAGTMTMIQLEAASELKRRLKRLENDSNRLVKINNSLVDAELPRIRFDESTGTLTMSHKGATQSIRLNRANSDVPVKLVQSTSLGAYMAGAEPPADTTPESEELKLAMEQMLEHYYINAFRITKLVQIVTGRSKYHVPEITLVRNKLIEHAELGSIYSFGFGSNGPVVKPIHRGQSEWRDAGLIPNANALAESLRSVFA